MATPPSPVAVTPSPIAAESVPDAVAPGVANDAAEVIPPHSSIATTVAAIPLLATDVTTDLTLDLPSRFAISDTTTQAFLVFDHITLYI